MREPIPVLLENVQEDKRAGLRNCSSTAKLLSTLLEIRDNQALRRRIAPEQAAIIDVRYFAQG